jgi:hypothetical protein
MKQQVMRTARKAAFIFGLLTCVLSLHGQTAAGAAAKKGIVVLDSEVSIVVAPDEPLPVQEAARDLADDFEKVLGSKPRISTGMQGGAGEVVLIGEKAKLPQAAQPAGVAEPESFSIAITGAPGQPGSSAAKAVVLAGADMRGTIYAIYEFSEEYLGVDPMYYWTDHQPLRRTHVEIPDTVSKTFATPVFKYRGFFLNDEDLLTGWAPGEEKDKTGISLSAWNKIYETILRLKGNMVVPGTWIFPDDPQIKLAAKRGLIVTQHHAIPLGVNVARWPRDVPYNYSAHPEILERAWKDAVAAYPQDQEILWAVGLRGLSDVSYASMDPSVRGNDQALGALISKAIQDQMSIVRAAHPQAQFVTDLWQEGATLVRKGYLKIPPEATTIWADLGYGYLQDGGQVASGQGAYYHVAMMNTRANQLTEMVPVGRIVNELGRYTTAGATQYLLVNTSDIRPVAMTTKATMDIAWKGSLPGGAEAADKYYEQWATEEFGKQAAPAVAHLYQKYFRAPAHFGNPPIEYGDQLYHTEARQMMATYMIDSPLYLLPEQSPKWEIPRLIGSGYDRRGGKEWLQEMTTREIQQCGDAQPRWDDVWKDAVAAEPLIPAARRPFYQASVLTMITINRESNRMLFFISKSIEDAKAGRLAQAQEEAAEAKHALDQVHQAQAAAEYGIWKNWYRGDWLTGVYRTQQALQDYIGFLKDPLAPLSPPIEWNRWEAYYHIMHYEGDRSADVQ